MLCRAAEVPVQAEPAAQRRVKRLKYAPARATVALKAAANAMPQRGVPSGEGRARVTQASWLRVSRGSPPAQ